MTICFLRVRVCYANSEGKTHESVVLESASYKLTHVNIVKTCTVLRTIIAHYWLAGHRICLKSCCTSIWRYTVFIYYYLIMSVTSLLSLSVLSVACAGVYWGEIPGVFLHFLDCRLTAKLSIVLGFTPNKVLEYPGMCLPNFWPNKVYYFKDLVYQGRGFQNPWNHTLCKPIIVSIIIIIALYFYLFFKSCTFFLCHGIGFSNDWNYIDLWLTKSIRVVWLLLSKLVPLPNVYSSGSFLKYPYFNPKS